MKFSDMQVCSIKRMVYVHPDIVNESHRFWYKGFREAVPSVLWISRSDWKPEVIANYRPDHIHFGSRAAPRNKWLGFPRFKELRRLIPDAVITTYRGGVGMGSDLKVCNVLNTMVDGAFGPTDSYPLMTWLPAPADSSFWYVVKPQILKYRIVFIGHSYVSPIRNTRDDLVIFLQKYYGLVIAGGLRWKLRGIRALEATSYEQNKVMYSKSLMGFNCVNDKDSKLHLYWSNRLMHMLMSGLCCVTYAQPGLSDIFEDGKTMILYADRKELKEKMDFYTLLENRDKVLEIGRAGREVAVGRWDTKIAVRRVLSVCRLEG